MRINVFLSHSLVNTEKIKGKTAIIIDALRATTTITEALHNNANSIIPVSNFDFLAQDYACKDFFNDPDILKLATSPLFKEAVSNFKETTNNEILLAGEFESTKINNFDLGNSPLEFSDNIVRNKKIILYTTNGTKASQKAMTAENVYFCCMNNFAYVADVALLFENDIEIICSGNNGDFSLEDTICAGALISELYKNSPNAEFSDTAKVALLTYEKYFENIKQAFLNTEHGKKLIDRGFEKDILFAAKENSSNIVPFMIDGEIVNFE